MELKLGWVGKIDSRASFSILLDGRNCLEYAGGDNQVPPCKLPWKFGAEVQ